MHRCRSGRAGVTIHTGMARLGGAVRGQGAGGGENSFSSVGPSLAITNSPAMVLGLNMHNVRWKG